MSLLLIMALSAGVSGIQQHDHSTMTRQGAAATSTLSAQQVADLLAGEGMGLARPAELNHYPGPKHVLDLASELGLSPEQRTKVEAVRAAMLAAAKKLGAEIVDAERRLDLSFQHAHIDDQRLKDLTAAIGKLQGELRAVHLSAHIATRQLLTPEQIQRYDTLRGYRK